MPNKLPSRFWHAICLIAVFTVVSVRADNAPNLKWELVSRLPTVQEMKISYRLTELKSLASGWLVQVAQTEFIAEFGESFRVSHMVVPGQPEFQLQFALQSGDGHFAIVLFKGFTDRPRQRVWQKMIVASADFPDQACLYDVHPDLSTTEEIEYNLKPEIVGASAAEAPRCEVITRANARR